MSKQTDANTTSTNNAGPHTSGTTAKAKHPFEMPFAMPMMPDAFGQMMRDQIARTQTVMAELASYEGVAIARARTAVDELARMAGDSISYVGQLSNEWRKLTVETMQRTADAFTPKA